MAIEYGIRELRNHTGDVVRAVESGEIVYLTSHRRRIAMVTPIRPAADPGLARLLVWIDGLPEYDSGLAEAVAEQRSADELTEHNRWR